VVEPKDLIVEVQARHDGSEGLAQIAAALRVHLKVCVEVIVTRGSLVVCESPHANEGPWRRLVGLLTGGTSSHQLRFQQNRHRSKVVVGLHQAQGQMSCAPANHFTWLVQAAQRYSKRAIELEVTALDQRHFLGILSPASRIAVIAPIATGSLQQKIPMGQGLTAISLVAAWYPASDADLSSRSALTMYSGFTGMPCRARVCVSPFNRPRAVPRWFRKCGLRCGNRSQAEAR
jgi:hypothetical protein